MGLGAPRYSRDELKSKRPGDPNLVKRYTNLGPWWSASCCEELHSSEGVWSVLLPAAARCCPLLPCRPNTCRRNRQGEYPRGAWLQWASLPRGRTLRLIHVGLYMENMSAKNRHRGTPSVLISVRA